LPEQDISPQRSVRVRIEGRVQGVFYRAWTEETAARLGLTGWVRNRRDGSVEALFAGPADKTERMLALCAEGPPQAAVTRVAIEEEGLEAPSGFSVRPTA
jgi:acylphosphatase